MLISFYHNGHNFEINTNETFVIVYMIQITNMKMKEIAKIYGLENCILFL